MIPLSPTLRSLFWNPHSSVLILFGASSKSTSVQFNSFQSMFLLSNLSGHFSQKQAKTKVVKIKNPDFSYWAWSTPWGHVLSLKSFCWNPVLSWAIRYSVFQLVKFTSSFKFVCRTIFSTFWHLVVKFEYNKWFLNHFHNSFFFHFGEISVKKNHCFNFFKIVIKNMIQWVPNRQ